MAAAADEHLALGRVAERPKTAVYGQPGSDD
jgi:hypothetical protein